MRTDRRGHHSSPSPAGPVVAQGFARSNAASSCNTTPANATCSMSMTISVNAPSYTTNTPHMFTNNTFIFRIKSHWILLTVQRGFTKIIHEVKWFLVIAERHKLVSNDATCIRYWSAGSPRRYLLHARNSYCSHHRGAGIHYARVRYGVHAALWYDRNLLNLISICMLPSFVEGMYMYICQ